MIHQLLSWILWPLFVAVNILILVVFAKSTEPQELAILGGPIFFGQLLVLLAFERVLPYRKTWSARGDRDIWRDIGHALAFGIVGQRLGGVLAVSITVLLVSGTGLDALNGPRGIWPGESPMLVQILLVIIFGDLLEYWLHRVTHTSKFWSWHALHHTPERLNVFKTVRHNVFYAAGRGLLVWLPLLMIGAPLWLLIWHPLSIGVLGSLGHSNIDFRIPGFVHRLLMTPHYHRIHHSIDPKLGNSNFSVVFPFWDILFGTFVDPRNTEVGEIGIRNNPIPRKFFQELLSPIIWRKLVKNQQAGKVAEESARAA